MIKKCILLAAGYGKRLLPITNNIPKCLVKIHGKPIIDYWFSLLKTHGVTHVLINTHQFHHLVLNYINSLNTSIEITVSNEKDLLGSLGTIIHNEDFYVNEDSLLVANADNLTNLNLSNLYDCHYANDYAATIALMEVNNPTQCGIVELGLNNKIISYEEKPLIPKTKIANAGVYLFNTSFLKSLENNVGFLDIGYDLLPRLVGKSYGYLFDDFLLDIGSHESLNRARKTSPNLFKYP